MTARKLQAVAVVEAETDDERRARIQAMVDRVGEMWVDLNKLIVAVYQERGWEALGYQTFNQMAVAEWGEKIKWTAELRKSASDAMIRAGVTTAGRAAVLGVSVTRAKRLASGKSGNESRGASRTISDPAPRTSITIDIPTDPVEILPYDGPRNIVDEPVQLSMDLDLSLSMNTPEPEPEPEVEVDESGWTKEMTEALDLVLVALRRSHVSQDAKLQVLFDHEAMLHKVRQDVKAGG